MPAMEKMQSNESDTIENESGSMMDEADSLKSWPETKTSHGSFLSSILSIWSSWSFSYMDPILRKGKSQFNSGAHLTLDDLYGVPDDMKSHLLVERFWICYGETNKSIIKALLKLSAPSFIPAGIWELVYVVSRVTLPISLRYLLIIIEERGIDNNPDLNRSVWDKGLQYAIALSLAAVVSSIAQGRVAFLSTKSGIMLRSALTTAIYRHSLRLTPAGRVGLTTGEVTNLVAVDTQKLFDVMLEGHNIWSCPLILIIVTYLLWVMVGPELTLGVAALILVLPIVKGFISRMLKIRKERSVLTDVRINVLSAMLQGIQVTKLNHYEGKVEEHVIQIRDQEMNLLRKELRMWGFVLTMAVVSPLLAFGIAFSFYALVDDDNIVKPSDAFTSLLLFSILRFPINMTARLVGKLAQAFDSARRISDFLERETRPVVEAIESISDGPVIDLKKCSFTVEGNFDVVDAVSQSSEGDKSASIPPEIQSDPCEAINSQPSFILKDLSMQVRQSEVVAVIGKVGSGKTMFLRALLGELPALDGTQEFSVRGKIAYSSQQAFILNTSLRDNILFGINMDQERYERTLDACCLREDIRRLGPAGDMTQIGERGVTLSGGQKQRVALARAVYSQSDVVLLDDCLSALDAETEKAVFNGLFESEGGAMLRSSATILVTHAINFLPRVSRILVIEEGCPKFYGTWEELQQSDGESKKIIENVRPEKTDKVKSKRLLSMALVRGTDVEEKDGFIMSIEEREYGITPLRVWVTWFHHAGGWKFALVQLLVLALDRGLYVFSDWWIAKWSDGAYESTSFLGFEIPPQTNGRSAQIQYVGIYAIIIWFSTIATYMRSQCAVAGGARCANEMFRMMTSKVLRAPMYYFETTPLGRTLNRFTYDVEVLDIELTISMTGLMLSFSWLASSVFVMAVVLPWMLVGIIPIAVVYFFLQLYYRLSGPDLQRIDAISRSPIQASLAEGLEGSATIRAYRREEKFSAKFGQCVNRNSAAMLNFIAAQRWLGLRIELLGGLVSLSLTMTIVLANDTLKIPPGLVGLVIQWSVIFSAALNFFFLRLTESEARITSIERISRTSELPQEADWDTDASLVLDPCWPQKGELEFDSVCMRYRKDLPLALDSVSFNLSPGIRCGVVGRTGSGKSSLTVALFRLVEIETGSIKIDGVDLSKLGLSDVRGRKNGLRIIPQDPILFAGTLRDCLDPFHTFTDDVIYETLQAVNHRGANERGVEILNDVVEEGGSNFSVGERQLLCLARAIIEEPKVLILDEATASVDTVTDAFIQKMLRTRFRNTTMLTIAHRLHTIMDFDVILVMDDGHVAEFGKPKELLSNPNGALSSFVTATGPESAAQLRKIAFSQDP